MQKKNDNVIENSKKKEKKNKDKKVSVFKKFFENLKEDYPIFILSIVSFLVISIITFFSVTKNVTIAAFSLNEYEIGQIADRNIVADRTIPANSKYPIAIHDGEKIIRKGFPITEEGYRKLEKMANEKEYIDYRAYANSVLYLLLLMILWTLLYSDVLLGRKLAFKELLLQIIFFTILYSCTLFAPKYPFFAQSPFHLCIAIPTAFVIFLITLLYGEKSALFYSIVLSLGILCAADYNIIVFLFTFCSCFSAARIVRKIETRIDMVFASVSIALLNILFLFL